MMLLEISATRAENNFYQGVAEKRKRKKKQHRKKLEPL